MTAVTGPTHARRAARAIGVAGRVLRADPG